MIREFLYKLTGEMPCRLIQRSEDERYLERYYVGELFGFTFYLHRFVSSDGDEMVHNHPWNALAVCLAGGYTEEFVTAMDVEKGWLYKIRTMFPGRINLIKKNDFHRIAKIKPETWTLFIHGKREVKWGFLEKVKEGVFFHQPYPVSNGNAWWEFADKGKNSSRLRYPHTL